MFFLVLFFHTVNFALHLNVQTNGLQIQLLQLNNYLLLVLRKIILKQFA